jgi:DNA helicase HerA-like ATPase
MESTDDRMRHSFIIGQTGTGKSTLMESMILQDIRNGKGVAVIDPHGEMIDSLLGKIPQERAQDVILFDVLDRDRPMGFNFLEWNTLDERDLIVDELYLSVARLYDMKVAGGPIFEANFRGMLKLLMGDSKREGFVPTLLEFTACYQNQTFRKWLQKGITDNQIKDFVEELEKTGGDASLHNLSPYITSKFSRFINDTTLKHIVGQEKTTFDFDEIINSGKIFLVKLGRGRFGATVSALLANQLVSRFKLAAMKRGGMKPEDRREFYLYVDECHTLPSENFMELLSEARKFRMGLVLATQYTAQLEESEHRKDSLLKSILGNVGTIIIFRVGKDDAVDLSPVLFPYFTPKDIVGLPNFHGYASMQLINEPTPSFSFRTEMEKTPYDSSMAAAISERSTREYGCDVAEVEKGMRRRRTVWIYDSDSEKN